MSQTADNLRVAFSQFELAIAALREALESAPDSSSRLALDEDRLGLKGVVTDYVDRRLTNAIVLAGEVRLAGIRNDAPGPHFDAVYPLLRACLEHVAFLEWLLQSVDQDVRLLRLIRVRREDESFAARNNALLVRAAQADYAMPLAIGAELERTMNAEAARVTTLYDSLASSLNIDVKASRAKLQVAAVLTELYGEDSTFRAHWKLLSDLSHFSFSLTGSFDAEHDFGVPLRSVTMTVFLRQVCTALTGMANVVTSAKCAAPIPSVE